MNPLSPADCQLFALLYGDHLELHQRLLSSLLSYGSGVPVMLWCNTVGEKTRAEIAKVNAAYPGSFRASYSQENVPKYLAMRQLFEPIKSGGALPRWVIWMDDDSYLTNARWFPDTSAFIRAAEQRGENICYIGQPWYVHYLPGQSEFIQRQPWYGKVPFAQRHGRPIVDFAQGAYWWLRTDILRKLDWPLNLRHNGGDTLLGEAVRQQGLPFHKYFAHVKINAGKRRGYSESPAGCTDPGARR